MTTNSKDKQYILIVAVLTAFAGSVTINAVIVALPAIGIELSMNAVQLGWIAQSFALAAAIFVLPFGRLADIWGRKRIFTLGLAFAVISTLLAALSNSFIMLVCARVMQGIGMTMLYSTGLALLTSAYPAAERGRVLGINVAAVSLGLSLGPTIGGILTQNIGWRSIFVFYIILVLPALILLLTKVKREWAESKGEKYDLTGSMLFAIMLFCIMYGFTLLPAQAGIWIIIAGAIGLFVFIFWELKVPSPIFNIYLLTKSRMFSFSTFSQLIYYTSIFSITVILSLYLQYIKGLSPQDAGFILLAQPVMQGIFSPLAGRVSDKIQPRIIVSAGIVVVLASLFLLLSKIEDITPLFTIIGLALLGMGHAFVTSPNTNAIMSSVDKKYFGVAASMDVTTRNIGMTLSMGIFILLLSLYMGSAPITPNNYDGFIESIRTILTICCIICLISIVVSAIRGKITFEKH